MKNILWVLLSFLFINSIIISCTKQKNAPEHLNYKLQEVAQSEFQWTGVAVSHSERIFINYPRWSANIPFSVGEVKGKEVASFDSISSLYNRYFIVLILLEM